MSNTVKIKILKTTVCGGKGVAAGKIVTASRHDANLLIGSGKAEIAKDAPPKKAPAKRKVPANKMVDPADIETRDVSE